MTLSKPFAIKLIFVIHAMLAGAFLTRVADVQTNLGLNDSELGTVLVAQPLGLLLTFAISSHVIERFGARNAIAGAIAGICGSVILLGLAASQWLLAAALFVFAVFFAILHVGMNVEADRVEASEKISVMSKCHGYWAFGFLATTMIGVFMRGWNIPVLAHLGIVSLAMFLIGMGVMSLFQPSPPRAHTGDTGRRPFFVLPSGTILILVIFGVSGALSEMAARSWAVIYMRDTFEVSDWVDTLSLLVFAIAVAGARMFADQFLEKVGTVLGARVLLGLAIVGTGLVALAPHPFAALLGFVLMGVGVCVSVPLMLGSAARIGDRPASKNVAAATLSNSMSLLVAPAAMGFASSLFGIQIAFALLIPFLLISFAVAGILKLRDQEPDTA